MQNKKSESTSNNNISSNQLLKYLYPSAVFAWIAVGALWLIAIIPKKLSFVLGRYLGLAFFHIDSRHRNIGLFNIQHCMSELSEFERLNLVREIFMQCGVGVVEASWSLFNSRDIWSDVYIKVDGVDALKEILEKREKPVILVGSHFTSIEMMPFLCNMIIGNENQERLSIVYRAHPNATISWLLSRRLRYVGQMLSSRDVRSFIKVLKNKGILWLPADQDVGKKGSIFAPFFGKTAATVTSPRVLAQKSGAEVFQIILQRQDNWVNGKPSYICSLVRMGQDKLYPSDDEQSDMAYQNEVLEYLIRKNPSQYLWLHKRFKTQPDGTNFYRSVKKQ